MASTSFVDLVTLTAASWFNDVDITTYSYLTSVAGTNTITATGPVPLGAYAAGNAVRFVPANTNTGATTINITPSGGAALGARNIFSSGAACVGGEIKSGVPCFLVDDGTRYHLVSPLGDSVGTTTNDSAAALHVGEYVESVIAIASAVTVTTTIVSQDITTISLTAGDWDVSLVAYFANIGSVTTRAIVWIGTTAGDNLTERTADRSADNNVASWNASAVYTFCVPSFRASLAATTTFRFKVNCQFAGTQPTVAGRISARRVR